MASKSQNHSGTLLGRMVVDRLKQLGVSRSQLSRQTGISRQTIWEITHNGRVNIAPIRLAALDAALHWPPGTAETYANGQLTKERNEGERITEYLRRIIVGLSAMSVDELEREAIWLEEELFGRTSNSHDEAMDMIRDAVKQVANSRGKGCGGAGSQTGNRKATTIA